MMPIGMSRCGFFASCAAVETASNPIYAKKMMPAACTTPLQPKWPNVPVFGGMNGTQFAPSTTNMPKPMNRMITATLIATTIALKRADWWMPT